jgi:tellurite resistance protein
MTSTIQSPYTDEQVSVWLRGLLTIAWSDGHFDEEEQKLISDLTHQELTADKSEVLQPISPEELAAALGHDPVGAENFIRMAVMVAVADGAYSFCEDELLHQYCAALGLQIDVLNVLRSTLYNPDRPDSEGTQGGEGQLPALHHPEIHLDVLHPVREWLDQMDIHDPKLARFLCRLIPPQCPFERDINLFGRRVAHIPPLCKLNPLYDQLVSLRFRALSYLADDCGEDVSPYCGPSS